nr:hypothetical protein [Desulfobacterales bacterium]
MTVWYQSNQHAGERNFFKGTIDADHLNQIGWWDRGELSNHRDKKGFRTQVKNFYLGIASDLKVAGLYR